eukprot:440782-Rhodomonas_salina.1
MPPRQYLHTRTRAAIRRSMPVTDQAVARRVRVDPVPDVALSSRLLFALARAPSMRAAFPPHATRLPNRHRRVSASARTCARRGTGLADAHRT